MVAIAARADDPLRLILAQAGDLAGVDGISALLAKSRGGSLVLDEVSDFDEDAQARLVRMLDVMGDHAPRVMATTQADLSAKMEAGKFRKDLFYRLGGVTLQVPPLRERAEDIALLARHFLDRAREDGLPNKTLDQGAIERLQAKGTYDALINKYGLINNGLKPPAINQGK